MTLTADRLTPLDGTFLELEDADPSAHMHIGAILVFGQRLGGPGAPGLDEVRTQLAERLDALPRYRQRLAGPGPGTAAWQEWVPDPHFDVARHVSAATLPDPGGWEELYAWAGDFFSARLERSLPLWQVVVLDGLGNGHWALVTKTHHCLVDGVGSLDAAHLLLDGVGEALAAAPPAGHQEAATRPWSALPLGPPAALAPVADGARAALHAALHPRELARRAAALGELLVRDEVVGAPATSLNGPIGPRRVLRGATVELDEVQRIRRALGGTVNDVVLAGATAGLRALLLGRGEAPPAAGLRAMVPMNVRRDGEALGNHISSLFVTLPVAEADPVVRHARICEETSAVKRGRQPLGADVLLGAAALAPPVLHRILAQTLFAKRLFNVTITNVPGPAQELSSFGAPLTTVWPLVPIAADHAIGIAVVSYHGTLTFGVSADHDSVEDVDVLAVGIAEGLAELQRLVPPEPTAQKRPDSGAPSF